MDTDAASDQGYDIVSVPLADFIEHENTLDCPPWEGDYRFDRGVIQDCLDQNMLEGRPWDSGDRPFQDADEDDQLYHAKRVAYLVRFKADAPISIDVGVESLGFSPPYLIQDGCHRLAAAIFRNDPEIEIDYAGSVDTFEEMFPNAKNVRRVMPEEHDQSVDGNQVYGRP